MNTIRLPAWAPLTCLCLLALDAAHADTLAPLWSLAPEERSYVTTGNTERGIAYNSVSRNVLLLSRAGGPQVYVLDARDGTDGSAETGEPRTLSLADASGESPVAGGTFALNLVGAAEDGAVYACNLATSLGTVKIYRWTDDRPDTPVSVAYAGDPLEGIANPGTGQDIRFGDTFAVRGSGKSTQLVQTARNGKYLVLYTTTDGLSFQATAIACPASIAGKIGLGVAFGEGDTLWAKANGNALLRLRFVVGGPAPSAELLGTVPGSVVSLNATGLGSDPAAHRLAVVDYVTHTVSVFDTTDLSGLVAIGDPAPFPSANANVNGSAAAALGPDQVFALESNNGVLALTIERSTTVDPPTLTSQPLGGTVYEGASFTFAVTVQGTPPFGYQWYFGDTTAISGATNAQLVLTNLSAAQAGTYTVAVINAANVLVTSTPATLTVRQPLASGILKPLWTLNPGDRPYLTTDNTQRGLSFNPATGRLLVASRSPANSIAVLDAATGTHLHTLRTTSADDAPVFLGGTLPLNMIGVADDGVVYAANLVTDASTSALQIYRWENDGPDAVPQVTTLSADLNLAERWGDTLDVRGRGASTEILLGSRGLSPQEGRKFAVLTTPDGSDFSARIYSVPDAPASAFGLGIAFGAGNTVFGTANGQPLVRVTFDPSSGSATLDRSFAPEDVPLAASFLGFLPSKHWLAAVALENPDNVQLFDLGGEGPRRIDQQLILPKQANANGTGSLDFGGDRLFVLDTNHGLRAFDLVDVPPPADRARLGQPTIASGVTSFQLTGTASRDYLVQTSADLRTWTDLGTFRPPSVVTDPLGTGARFYRALAR